MTVNNWTPEDKQAVMDFPTSYCIIGEEIGEFGTKHLQIYFEMANQMTLSALKKKLHKTAHFEVAIACAKQNKKYCSKEGRVYESGDMKKQGARTDLNQIKDDIVSGKTSVDQIVMDNPFIYHEYARTLHKIEDLKMRKLFRTEMTTGTWYHGPTATGKSHTAFEGYHPDTHYLWKDDNGWNDGYAQQATIIINDFRGHIKYADLLQMVDKWPWDVRRRGREPMPFISKHVIITSSMTPEEVYSKLAENDELDQILRRFKVIELSKQYKDSEV